MSLYQGPIWTTCDMIPTIYFFTTISFCIFRDPTSFFTLGYFGTTMMTFGGIRGSEFDRGL
jgi:hypothetical protein